MTVEIRLKEVGWMIREQEMEPIHMLMVIVTLEIGKRIRRMDRV
jgi:hypothetical protein